MENIYPFFIIFPLIADFFWDEAQIIRGNEGIVGLSAPSLKGTAVRGAVQMSVIAALGAVAVDELEQLRTPVALVERRIVQEAEDGPLPRRLERGLQPQRLARKHLARVRAGGVLLIKPAARAAEGIVPVEEAVVEQNVNAFDAVRREKEAEAQRRAIAAEKIASAKALEEAYAAEQQAEQARAAREFATKQADIITAAKVEKERKELEAEAEAEQRRRRAKGEADAIFATMEAQARGVQEILAKQAEGYKKVVAAAGGDTGAAIQMLLVDKLEDLTKIQVEAIKNLQIDKITVWDSMGGKNGGSTTADFLSGIMKAVPPLADTLKMAGVEMPAYLVKTTDTDSTPPAPADDTAE